MYTIPRSSAARGIEIGTIPLSITPIMLQELCTYLFRLTLVTGHVVLKKTLEETIGEINIGQ